MVTAPYTPQTRRELLEVHADVFLSAPDDFLQLPNARPGEEITLDSSFGELRRGVDHVYRKERHASLRKQMHDVLDMIYAEFKAGHRTEARVMCHDFEALVADNKP